MSALTMTDLFCGAGGSSTGAVSVPGVSVRLAANHWDKAVETHNANHPTTDHLQADISNTDPRYVPSTDLLWASPECTNHSRAKGRKAHLQPDLFGDVLPDEATQRSRATMWDVVRFTEAHDYRAVIVENVVEVADWSSPTGIRGGLFHAWLTAMHAMGYRHRIISLNSMHAQAGGLPAPQSRDRVYITFWRTGDRAPDFEPMLRPAAYCPTCDEMVGARQWWKNGKDGQDRPGRYRQQYLYRCPNTRCRNQVLEPAWLPAASIIDWTNPGIRIGDRDKPLADKTLHRIRVGIDRYWGPMLAEHGGNPYDAADPRHPRHGHPDSYYRVWPLTDPTQTMHTRESKALAWHPLAVPAGGTWNDHARTTTDTLTTRTTRETDGLAFPPLVAELRGGGSTARTAADPLATVTASGNHHALVHRHNGGGPEMTTPAGEPVRTITTTGHQSVLSAERPTLDLDDVHFRMLEPHEIKQAMAFDADYAMVGNRREQVRLAGNAVTPPAARDLIATMTAAITGEDHTTTAPTALPASIPDARPAAA